MYSKIMFEDWSSVESEELFNQLENNEITLEKIIKNEIIELESKGVIFEDKEKLIIKTPNFKIKSSQLPFVLEKCNQKGSLISNQKENQFKNKNNIKTCKNKIIINYLKEKGCQNFKILYDGNIISFKAPFGNQHSDNHTYIVTKTFEIKSFSESDRQNPIWTKETKKITKELKELWKNSNEKKQLCYNYNSDYLNPIIENNFPKIIKQKKTNVLFRYDENLKYYVEMIENKNQSELTKYIQSTMFNDNNDLLNIKQISEVKEYIKNTYDFTIKEFERCNLINCNNGILNIITKELMEHSSDYFFNYKSSINYNNNADNTKLSYFINNVVTEKEPLLLLSKILGHIHLQQTKLQKGFLFVGTKRGRNGKGTLVKLIREVIGIDRTVTMPINSFESNTFAEYNLKDKALYIDDDYKAEYISQKNIGMLNSMITGVETKVHQKNQPSINIKYTSIPLIQCNKLPKLKADDDGGFYDRWVQISFNNEFGDKMNEFLGDELLNDKDVMSSMLNLLVFGYNLILERKKESKIGTFFKDNESNLNWKTKNNQVIEFCNECCQLSSNYKISSRSLYNFYKNDWNLGGMKMSETKFISQLKDNFHLETKRINENNKKVSYLIGISCDEIIDFENIKSEV